MVYDLNKHQNTYVKMSNKNKSWPHKLKRGGGGGGGGRLCNAHYKRHIDKKKNTHTQKNGF